MGLPCSVRDPHTAHDPHNLVQPMPEIAENVQGDDKPGVANLAPSLSTLSRVREATKQLYKIRY